MKVTIEIERVHKGRVSATDVAELLPDQDTLLEYWQRIIPAVLPVTFRLQPAKGAAPAAHGTITFDDE